ncbi:MAG: hypothetical protein IJG63_09310, partial [Oscillospiraceae bacterium]|nr:hypothetical protein [Oscillospiraceae bacterium]
MNKLQAVYSLEPNDPHSLGEPGLSAYTLGASLEELDHFLGAGRSANVPEGRLRPCTLRFYDSVLGFVYCRSSQREEPYCYIHMLACGQPDEPGDYCFPFEFHDGVRTKPQGGMDYARVEPSYIPELSASMENAQLAWLMREVYGVLLEGGRFVIRSGSEGFVPAAVLLHRLLLPSMRLRAATADVDTAGYNIILLPWTEQAQVPSVSDLPRLEDSDGIVDGLFLRLAELYSSRPRDFALCLKRLDSELMSRIPGADLSQFAEAAFVLLLDDVGSPGYDALSKLHMALSTHASHEDSGFWTDLLERLKGYLPPRNTAELVEQLKAGRVGGGEFTAMIQYFHLQDPERTEEDMYNFWSQQKESFRYGFLLELLKKEGAELACTLLSRRLADGGLDAYREDQSFWERLDGCPEALKEPYKAWANMSIENAAMLYRDDPRGEHIPDFHALIRGMDEKLDQLDAPCTAALLSRGLLPADCAPCDRHIKKLLDDASDAELLKAWDDSLWPWLSQEQSDYRMHMTERSVDSSESLAAFISRFGSALGMSDILGLASAAVKHCGPDTDRALLEEIYELISHKGSGEGDCALCLKKIGGYLALDTLGDEHSSQGLRKINDMLGEP